MKKQVETGDIITLLDTKQKTYIIDTTASTDLYRGIGVINPKDMVNKTYGSQIEIGNKQFYILEPTLPDTLKALKRKAQIILPKDAAQIIIHCSITPGKKIVEAGIGSGSLTTVLASIVGKTGKIISYDNRKEFIDHALKNLKKTHLDRQVTVKQKDITTGIDETNIDAVILDIPNPWEAVSHAYDALSPGGYLCTYSPLISQVEQTVNAIQKQSFISVKTIETIEREMIVGPRGTRPSFHMLGHTGYLTFARKVL